MNTPLPSTPTPERVAIVGAGPAGLATARALQKLNIPFDVFEQHGEPGGIWNRSHPGTPMYRSAHFISSRKMSGHLGFPMPDNYPDYPSNSQILAYIKSFAVHYKLDAHIRFHTRVLHAEPSSSGGWELDVQTANEAPQRRHYGWLVCASGTNWTPNRPLLAGEEEFTGEIMHAVDYNDESQVRDQRVLVVGAGNSGVDIACDAAFSAKRALISMRRGYHFVPKHIFGIPADEFGEGSRWLPGPIRQRLFGLLLRIVVGDLTRLGLQKPDHPVLSSHPILNAQILHYLQHGDLEARVNIDRVSGQTVFFRDGRQDDVDIIILATGYHWHLPYLHKSRFTWQHERPQAYLKIFHPDQPRLFLNGFIETDGGAYKLFDEMAYVIARSIQAQRENSQAAQQLQHLLRQPEPDLGGAIHYIHSPRHTGYTNSKVFRKRLRELQKDMGWTPSAEAFYNAPGIAAQ